MPPAFSACRATRACCWRRNLRPKSPGEISKAGRTERDGVRIGDTRRRCPARRAPETGPITMAGTPRRRTDEARMKAKARQLYPHDPSARNANHLAACSCWMCGNPRRHLAERTMQERRAEAADRLNDARPAHRQSARVCRPAFSPSGHRPGNWQWHWSTRHGRAALAPSPRLSGANGQSRLRPPLHRRQGWSAC